MLSNIMSTAVGVGVGHAIGHGLTGLFGGGSSAPAATDNAAAATPETNSNTRIGACDADAKAFTRCMDDYKGDMTVCSWYLEQLKVLSFLRIALIVSHVSRWRVNTRLNSSFDINVLHLQKSR